MRKMKYVLNVNTGHFLLIPDIGMQHSDVFGVEKWTNAGFVNFDDARDECGNVVIIAICFGKSVSLNLESGPKDSEIISRAMKDNW